MLLGSANQQKCFLGIPMVVRNQWLLNSAYHVDPQIVNTSVVDSFQSYYFWELPCQSTGLEHWIIIHQLSRKVTICSARNNGRCWSRLGWSIISHYYIMICVFLCISLPWHSMHHSVVVVSRSITIRRLEPVKMPELPGLVQLGDSVQWFLPFGFAQIDLEVPWCDYQQGVIAQRHTPRLLRGMSLRWSRGDRFLVVFSWPHMINTDVPMFVKGWSCQSYR